MPYEVKMLSLTVAVKIFANDRDGWLFKVFNSSESGLCVSRVILGWGDITNSNTGLGPILKEILESTGASQ